MQPYFAKFNQHIIYNVLHRRSLSTFGAQIDSKPPIVLSEHVGLPTLPSSSYGHSNDPQRRSQSDCWGVYVSILVILCRIRCCVIVIALKILQRFFQRLRCDAMGYNGYCVPHPRVSRMRSPANPHGCYVPRVFLRCSAQIELRFRCNI